MRNKILTGIMTGSALLVAVASNVHGCDGSVEANKKVVHDFYRFAWEPRNLGAFEKGTSEDYIEHNPNFPGARENIIQALSGREAWQTPKPVQDSLQDPPEFVIAEGDLVQWVFKRTATDPNDPSKTYEFFWYDTFRVRGCEIVEHWDNAVIKPR